MPATPSSDPATLRRSLRRTASWFLHSGIMLPADGSWGVAERVLLTDANEALDSIYQGFPAWTPHKGHCILESRRADCNFETALLFLLLSEVFHDRAYYDVAHNILRFLYHRSALLKRFDDEQDKAHPASVWNWSHQCWKPAIYFDDNSWCCALQLLIGKRWPEFDAEFHMTGWALRLADLLAAALPAYLRRDLGDKEAAPAAEWLGNTLQPHFGALACMALARACRETPKAEWRDAAELYLRYLLGTGEDFAASEYAYALIGASHCLAAFGDDTSRDVLALYRDRLLAKMDPETGNLPAEHREAPRGARLADTIYTLNWALLGLGCARAVADDAGLADAENKLRALLLDIQDDAPEAHLNGAWRGMYDLETRSWGGGNCYEGGAGSIYSGWTNAPIGCCMAFALLGSNLVDF